MAVNLSFKINGQEVTPFVGWHAAEITVQLDAEALTLGVELQKVKLVQDAAQIIQQSGYTALGVPVELTIDGVTMRGRVFAGSIYYGNKYVIISAELDTATLFAKMVEGRLIDESWRQDVKVLVAPRVDRAAILALSFGGLIMIYMAVKETIELIKDIATGAGVSGAGVGGPISGAIMMIVFAVIRVVFIALMVVAVINLIKQIKDLLQRTMNTRGFRLAHALQQFAQGAGFTISNMPGWLEDVWIIGGGVEQYEAGELFRLAKQLTRSVLFANGTQIKFVSLSATFPGSYRVAHEEVYRHNLDEVKRRTLISLVRDTSDEHTRGVPAAAEIDRQGLVGLERVDIPYAPAVRAGKTPAYKAALDFLKALKVFGAKFSNVTLALKNMEDLMIVEREQFLPKLVYVKNPQKLPPTAAKDTLVQIAQAYQIVMPRRVYENVRMPLSAAAFLALMQQGFPGVRRLQWKFADGLAEIDYEVPEQAINLSQNLTIV